MAMDMNMLSEQLVNKSFADCSAEELSALTAQYPYFSVAHFLLLKKLDPSTEEYRRQYQKALLYFHNPLSFEYFINNSKFQTDIDLSIATEDEQVAAEILQGSDTKQEWNNDSGNSNDSTDALVQTQQDIEPVEPAIPVPSMKVQQSASDDTLTFEPFHTVDYFASQGIKLSQQESQDGQFGKQLKSFTDWLKTMKRIPAAQKMDAIDPVSEKKVEHLAGDSLQNTEILTESMAEVWEKQGNKQKAIEVYEKLSLSEPSKSAYFAAKIQSLKE